MADRIKNYQQEADQITTLKAIRTDLGVTPSSYTPDATVVTKDRVVTFAQAEEEMVVLSDIEKGVKQQVVKGDIADKRLTNIEKLLQGNLYDYQTDSTSAYTKSVPAGAMPYAGIEQIGGKTVVWNQLVDSGTTSVATISGRKYYTLIDGTASIVASSGSAISIVDDSADMVCDLTLMFGSGSEPSTVEDFWEMFPADYYPYNAGTLLSAGVTEVVSVGRNLLNPAEVVNGSINSVDGSERYANNRLRTAFIPVEEGITYTISCKTTDVSASDRIIVLEVDKYGANKEYLGYNNENVFSVNYNVPSNVRYVKLLFKKANNGVILPSELQEPMIVKGSNVPYIPYTKTDYPIPASIQALEGYGWSAGSVYNYVDFENKKFIKNVGVYQFTGNEGGNIYTSDSTHFIFYFTGVFRVGISNRQIVVDKLVVNDTISSVYSLGLFEAFANKDSQYSNFMYICLPYSIKAGLSESSTNAEKFSAGKEWLVNNNVTMYYQLDTPTETDISAYLTDDNLIEVESGGTLTFENQHGDDYRLPVPSEETYMIDLQEAINNG